jgi:SAM-dependent methyltransferase
MKTDLAASFDSPPISERGIYASWPAYALNQVLFPIKQIVPQPIVAKLPLLTTNEDIRVRFVKSAVRGSLLDVGCGKNRLVAEYRAEGGEGLGVDVYDWGSCDLVVADTSRLPFENGRFDTISFVACLNHIPNRIDVLKEAKRLLAAGGRVLITNLAPGISRIWHTYAFWDADQHERGMAEGEVYGFTADQLQTIVASAGLRVAARHKFSWGLNELFVCAAA